MSTRAAGRIEVKTWDETPYDETEGSPRLVRVAVSETFDGDIEGEGQARIDSRRRRSRSFSDRRWGLLPFVSNMKR
jgi:hypothetical protein